VTSASAGTLDEAYERLHVTGPEFDGFLSNHGPMAAEARSVTAGQSREETAREVFARAVEHGDAHVIKFADTAVDVFARTGNPDAIAAALRAAELIQP
jgi:hypothetical protein